MDVLQRSKTGCSNRPLCSAPGEHILGDVGASIVGEPKGDPSCKDPMLADRGREVIGEQAAESVCTPRPSLVNAVGKREQV